MRRITYSLTLVFSLMFVPLGQFAHAQSQDAQHNHASVSEAPAPQTEADAAQTAKIKEQVTKRLANKKTHVKIRMRNGSAVDGRITEAQDEWFSLTEDKTGRKVEMSYSAVQKVNGRGMSGRMKAGIVVAALAGAAAILAALVIHDLGNWD
jgi:sRNA-binding regulator protein Hfq